MFLVWVNGKNFLVDKRAHQDICNGERLRRKKSGQLLFERKIVKDIYISGCYIISYQRFIQEQSESLSLLESWLNNSYTLIFLVVTMDIPADEAFFF